MTSEQLYGNCPSCSKLIYRNSDVTMVGSICSTCYGILKKFSDTIQQRAAKCRETCVHEYKSGCIAFALEELKEELLTEKILT